MDGPRALERRQALSTPLYQLPLRRRCAEDHGRRRLLAVRARWGQRRGRVGLRARRLQSPFGERHQGLDRVFNEAGFQWRAAGCSMCLAMNPDKLQGREVCASSSNRNFKGRQGSPTGRTLLMSPAMVAAAAIQGHVTDVRELASTNG